MKKILNIPHYSQYSENIEKDWQERSCAIACLKMVFDFLNIKTEAMDLIKEGLFISDDLVKRGKPQEGYSKEFGWGHGVLVMILRNHGVLGYAQEFRAVDVDIKTGKMMASEKSEFLLNEGLKKIEKNIENNLPVIVSIYKYFTEKDRHHMITIIGYEKNVKGEFIGFFYHDPELPKEQGGAELFIEINKFKSGWKKAAIFVD
jgi:hypothetical protein